MFLTEEDVKSIWNITNRKGIFLFLWGIHLGLFTVFTWAKFPLREEPCRGLQSVCIPFFPRMLEILVSSIPANFFNF